MTRTMLQEKLAEVNRESRTYPTTINRTTRSTNNNSVGNQTVQTEITLVEKTIEKVQGDTMIAVDGTKAKLFNPIPGMKWKCTGVASSDGTFTLEQQLTGLFLTIGNTSYCLGVNGDTKEFEVQINVDEQEITLNQNFINLSYERLVEQGVERK